MVKAAATARISLPTYPIGRRVQEKGGDTRQEGSGAQTSQGGITFLPYAFSLPSERSSDVFYRRERTFSRLLKVGQSFL